MIPPLDSASIDPQRILMVTPRYFPEIGGVENHVYQVASRLARLGHEITVLTTDRQGNLPPNDCVDGVQIQRVRAWTAQSDYYFAPGLFHSIQPGQWDLVHIQSYHTMVAPMAMVAAGRAKIPYVLTFHGGGHSSRLRNAARGLQLALLRPLLAHARALIVVARFEKQLLGARLHFPKERFVLIPNGADLPKPAQSRPSPSRHAGVRIASIGRLERYKGHQRIIAAMPAILKVKPQARLWIAGNGPYEPALRKLVHALALEGSVEFKTIPPNERERMAEELLQTDLVVLLSEYETQPLAILEALALGRPALVADSSGLSELHQQGLARAISLTSTPEQIASAALELLSCTLVPDRLEIPSWDVCTAELIRLYRKVLTPDQAIVSRARNGQNGMVES